MRKKPATPPPEEVPPPDDVRIRILEAASSLIAEGGEDAATTRSVAAAAGVQAPTLYRHFGDKRGLLEAVAEHALGRYVADKARHAPDPDPLEDLRRGWDVHVAFGLAHPGLYAIMSGDTEPGRHSPAIEAGLAVLRQRVRAIAQAGRLRTSEARALTLIQAFCEGTVRALLRVPPARRDPGLSVAAREAVLAALTGEAPALGKTRTPHTAAAALRANLGRTGVLSPGERSLLEELLDRIASAP